MYCTVLVPLKNEEGSLRELVEKLLRVLSNTLKDTSRTFEIILIDDGSTDSTAALMGELSAQNPQVRAIHLRKNFGKAVALHEGIARAQGEILITIDGDLQDDPEEIPMLLAKLEEGYDVVSSWKKERKDSFEKRIASKLFNRLAQKLTGLPLHDLNCGFKAYRGWCVRSLHLRGNLHRFIPVLVAQQGGKIAEIAVRHHPRRHGKSKYGFSRYFHGILDLFTILLITRFFSNPIYFFGLLAAPLLAGGGIILGGMVCAHLYWLISGDIAYAMSPRPILLISLALLGFGLNFLLFGALAEFVLHLSGFTMPWLAHRVKEEKLGRVQE